jgi:hypothetical protein
MRHLKSTNGLNPIQIGLLRMFDRNIPEEDIVEIKQVLVQYLSKQLLQEVDRVVSKKGITEEDFRVLEGSHFRTSANE